VTANPPVRHLWILRHAKAASDPPWGGGDQDRPLTARGRRDASALGKRLAADPVDLALAPDPETRHSGPDVPPRPGLAICSAAVRTRQTTDLIVEALGGALPVSAYRSLYAADPELVLQYVREIDEGARSALLVGHNPTVLNVAWQLLAVPAVPEDPLADRNVLEAHGFPTCALAVLRLAVGSWEDVVHGCGSLAGVFKPPY
jgi:phosphohistidine phosphatase